jgi:hypothetical protein
MNDTKLKPVLDQKYGQIVLDLLLDAGDQGYAFSALLNEVNAIVGNESRGATELTDEGEYSSRSLNSVLDTAEDAGIVERYLADGEKRWRLRPSQLSSSQRNNIRSRNSSGTTHADTAAVEHYGSSHADSTFE